MIGLGTLKKRSSSGTGAYTPVLVPPDDRFISVVVVVVSPLPDRVPERDDGLKTPIIFSIVFPLTLRSPDVLRSLELVSALGRRPIPRPRRSPIPPIAPATPAPIPANPPPLREPADDGALDSARDPSKAEFSSPALVPPLLPESRLLPANGPTPAASAPAAASTPPAAPTARPPAARAPAPLPDAAGAFAPTDPAARLPDEAAPAGSPPAKPGGPPDICLAGTSLGSFSDGSAVGTADQFALLDRNAAVRRS